MQNLDDLLVIVLEACMIKGVTPLRATEAAKQLAICKREISALILIAYRHP